MKVEIIKKIKSFITIIVILGATGFFGYLVSKYDIASIGDFNIGGLVSILAVLLLPVYIVGYIVDEMTQKNSKMFRNIMRIISALAVITLIVLWALSQGRA